MAAFFCDCCQHEASIRIIRIKAQPWHSARACSAIGLMFLQRDTSCQSLHNSSLRLPHKSSCTIDQSGSCNSCHEVKCGVQPLPTPTALSAHRLTRPKHSPCSRHHHLQPPITTDCCIAGGAAAAFCAAGTLPREEHADDALRRRLHAHSPAAV